MLEYIYWKYTICMALNANPVYYPLQQNNDALKQINFYYNSVTVLIIQNISRTQDT